MFCKINYEYSKDYSLLYQTLFTYDLDKGAVVVGFTTDDYYLVGKDLFLLDDDYCTDIHYLHKSNIKKILRFYGFGDIPLISFVNYCKKINLRFIPI
jgi:hypothetical protein